MTDSHGLCNATAGRQALRSSRPAEMKNGNQDRPVDDMIISRLDPLNLFLTLTTNRLLWLDNLIER
jgi:hypothetical protein